MLFKKKKKDLVASPLGYWEEKSYMLAIPANNDEDLLSDSINRIATIKDVEIKEHHYNIEKNFVSVTLYYQDEEYEIGFYAGDVSVPEYYLNKNFLFQKQDYQALLDATKALTIFMEFNDNIKKSYHLQLKLASAMVPSLIGVMDESAETVFPAKWVKMAAASNVLPNPISFFTVQAVKGENGQVWLHTHGLCRCGVTELEILDSNEENCKNHYNLLSTYALFLLERKNKDDQNSAYIGQLINGFPIVVTHKLWTEGILKYDHLQIGNIEDRKNGHNSKTSIIFAYKSEEDEKNDILSKVSIYNELLGDNPLFFISNDETARMKKLAIERFDYVKECFKVKENKVLIKIGLPLKEEDKFEHIWFELLEVEDQRFKARLTQEPYDVDDIHEGYEGWYTKKDITDWIIYTPDMAINPDNVYLLEK